MVKDSYRLNRDYRQQVDGEIRQAVQEFQSGSLGAIAVSRRLSGLRFIVERERPDLAAALVTFIGIDGDTDAQRAAPLPVLWHPRATRAKGQKLRHADEQHHERLKRACDEVARLLP